MWNCVEMGFHIENIFYPGNRKKWEIVKKLQWKRTFLFLLQRNSKKDHTFQIFRLLIYDGSEDVILGNLRDLLQQVLVSRLQHQEILIRQISLSVKSLDLFA